MKKTTAIALSMITALALTACGSSQKTEKPAETTAAADAGTAAEKTETEKADSEKPAESDLAYPEKDITIIVPYDAGGGNDILARILTSVAMEGKYFKGVNLVVENQPGGGGAIGQNYVAKTADPDGYTLLTFTGSAITNPILKDVAFTVDDFNIIVGCNPDPAVLTASNNAPYNNLEEFLEYAQNNEVLITDSGFGTNSHIRGLAMSNTLADNYQINLKLKAMHVDSSNMQLTQLMGGHADVSIMTAGECADAVNEGNVKAIAVLAADRVDALPDVPTFKEKGYEGIIDGADRCIAVSSQVPEEICNYLVEEFGRLCSSEEFKTAMKEANMLPASKTPEEMNDYISSMTDKITGLKDYLEAGVD